MRADCEMCMNYAYDEEFDEYTCVIDMDEIFSLLTDQHRGCPYFRMGDDYTIVRKQN